MTSILIKLEDIYLLQYFSNGEILSDAKLIIYDSSVSDCDSGLEVGSFLGHKRLHRLIPEGGVDLVVFDAIDKDLLSRILNKIHSRVNNRTIFMLKYSGEGASKSFINIFPSIRNFELKYKDFNYLVFIFSENPKLNIFETFFSKYKFAFEGGEIAFELENLFIGLLVANYSCRNNANYFLDLFDNAPNSEKFLPEFYSINDFKFNVGDINSPRNVSNWWGRTLFFLPESIKVFVNSAVFMANGLSRACFLDEKGRLVQSYSSITRNGYGVVRSFQNNFPTIAYNNQNYCLNDLPSIRELEYLAEDVFLIGRVDSRFGHFLTESMSHLWCIDYILNSNMKIAYWTDEHGTKLPEYQENFFKTIGFFERMFHIKRNMKFLKVHTSTPGYRLVGSISKNMKCFWNHVVEKVNDLSFDGLTVSDKIYLSRSKNDNRALENEVELEFFLESCGYTIIHPQDYSLEQQIFIVNRAKLVVGQFGSQMHLSMFMNSSSRKLVICNSNFVGPDETLISASNGVVTYYYVEELSETDNVISSSWKLNLTNFKECFSNFDQFELYL